MIKRSAILFLLLALKAQATTISIQDPCSKKSLVSAKIPQHGSRSVSEVSYQFFSTKGISVQGSRYNVDKIWDQPKDDLRQYQRGHSTYYFGWCYAVNGKVPDKVITQQKVNNSDHIQWFLGYMNNSNGRWNNECRPAYTLSFNPFCQKRNLQAKATTQGVLFSDQSILAWASEVIDFSPGSNLISSFADPSKALGPVSGNSSETVSLGAGGQITLSFKKTLYNRRGADFVVFENAFMPEFLELAYVEVSSDGVNFARFPSRVNQLSPIGPYGLTDPNSIKGLAGKYSAREGQAFDLGELQELDLVKQGTVDLNGIKFIKIIDIIGDGRSFDSRGEAIYDPFPTQDSAGFDLAGIGVFHIR